MSRAATMLAATTLANQRRRLGALAAALAAAACSSFDGGSDVAPGLAGEGEPAQEAASAALNPASPGQDWSCLEGQPAAPVAPFTADANDRIVYSVQFVDLATLQPSPGVQAVACGLTDVDCARPLAGPAVSNENGWIDVPLFAGFRGYLEITGRDILPGLLYLSSPLTENDIPDSPYLVLSLASLEALGRVLGLQVEPTQGLISLRVFDCQRALAAGLSFSKSGPGVGWYFVAGLPSVSAQATGPDGIGGFINVPSGVAELDVRRADGAAILGRQSLVVRPGWFSSAFLFPPGSQRR